MTRSRTQRRGFSTTFHSHNGLREHQPRSLSLFPYFSPTTLFSVFCFKNWTEVVMCRFLLLRLSSFRVLFLLNDVLKWTAWFIKIDYTALRTRCYSFFFFFSALGSFRPCSRVSYSWCRCNKKVRRMWIIPAVNVGKRHWNFIIGKYCRCYIEGCRKPGARWV